VMKELGFTADRVVREAEALLGSPAR